MLAAYEPPSGHGVRVNGYGYTGYRTNPRFNSLLAKVIVHDRAGWRDAAAKARRALSEFRVSGVPSNMPFLHAVLGDADFVSGAVHTRFVEERAGKLIASATTPDLRWFEPVGAASATRLAGAQVDPLDPLAVVRYGKEAVTSDDDNTVTDTVGPEGTVALRAPMQGLVVSLAVSAGDTVHARQEVLVMEAMKMQTASLPRPLAS